MNRESSNLSEKNQHVPPQGEDLPISAFGSALYHFLCDLKTPVFVTFALNLAPNNYDAISNNGFSLDRLI